MRLSPAVLRLGSRRPEVVNLRGAFKAVGRICGDGHQCHVDDSLDQTIREFQVDAFGAHDGKVGRNTWTRLIEEASAVGWVPDRSRQVQAVIAYYETGICRDAYGMTSRLADGAGVNYGVLQHNRLGSLSRVLRMGGRGDLLAVYKAAERGTVVPEIKAWMRSAKGIDTQDRYYQEVVGGLVNHAADMIPETAAAMAEDPVMGPRFRLLLFDSITQNGALFSPKRKPFWWRCTPAEERSAKFRELRDGVDFGALRLQYLGFPLALAEVKAHWRTIEAVESDREEVNRRTCAHIMAGMDDNGDRLQLLAQWRARSSSPKWWRDVESRRMLDATGRGLVHGSRLSLSGDFGFPA